MNLLFLTQTYPRFAGDTSGPFIRDLARGLALAGDSVTILAPHAAGLAKRWLDDGVEVITFRYAPEKAEVLGYSRSLSSDESVRPAAAVAAPFYAVAARSALRRQLRRGRYDLLHAHWVVPNGLVAATLADRVPVAVGLHGSDVFLAERALVSTLVHRALKRVRLVTGCSPELVDRVCALGFERRRAEVIPYGVDTDLFSPDEDRRSGWRARLGVPPEAPLILAVGRMVTKKGFQVLIGLLPELLSRCADAHLVLAGAGDRLAEFRAAAGRWPDRVHLPGVVLRDTLPDLYRAADLFVLPAVHDPRGNVDGLPNVILEAMASGLPVIASRISGIPLAIEDGVEGRLVPEHGSEALLAALLELLDDPGRRREMGRAARRRAELELTWKAVAARYRAAYSRALSGLAAAD